MAYTAFGETYAPETSVTVEQRYTYTGRESNSVSGTMYYRYRFYEAGLGRWTARDPIGYRGGINLYGYVENRPYSFYDPFGRKGLCPKTEVHDNLGLDALSATSYATKRGAHRLAVRWIQLGGGVVFCTDPEQKCKKAGGSYCTPRKSGKKWTCVCVKSVEKGILQKIKDACAWSGEFSNLTEQDVEGQDCKDKDDKEDNEDKEDKEDKEDGKQDNDKILDKSKPEVRPMNDQKSDK